MHVSLEEASELRYAAEPTDSRSPESAYDARWALTLLERVLGQMRADYAMAGRERLFLSLQGFLWGADGDRSYAGLAEQLSTTEGAVRVAVHRLRDQYRQRLRAEVAHTVDHPDQIDDELHYLIRVLSGDPVANPV